MSFRRGVLLLLLVAVFAVGGAAVALAGTVRDASSTPEQPISREAATAAALKLLPSGGVGFTLVEVQFEASSRHFRFTGAKGQGFGEDGVRECLAIPPLPPLPVLSPCRYYPVWVVDLTSPDCDVVIAINAYSGRFGGGGVSYSGSGESLSGPPDSCAMTPDAPAQAWWRAAWD